MKGLQRQTRPGVLPSHHLKQLVRIAKTPGSVLGCGPGLRHHLGDHKVSTKLDLPNAQADGQ
jgi:hypothetical protein